MGIGIRIFIVNDDGSLQRLSLARYEKLLGCDLDERLPQYAGRRVRYALAVLEVVDRKPVEITRIEYSFLHFDPEGRIDAAEQERELRLAMEVLPPVDIEQDSQQVIDAQHRFAKKRYDDEYKWFPSPEIETAIVAAIFGKDR